MSDETIYQEIILDHYKRPLHRGLREPYDAEVRHNNPTCGDEITLRVKVDGGRVADVSYDGEGCSISQASASVMADLLIGKSIEDATHVQEEFLRLMQSKGELEPDENVLEDAVAFRGVSRLSNRVKCALLAWMAWRDATARVVAGTGDAA